MDVANIDVLSCEVGISVMRWVLLSRAVSLSLIVLIAASWYVCIAKFRLRL